MLVCVLVRWKRSTTTPETGSNRTCMIIQIPDALTQHHSEEYRISIRLQPDGFSFSGYSPLQAESFFHAVVPFVSGVSRVEAMQQLWNENSCLQWRYQQLFVQGGTSHYTWVPDEDLDDEEKAAWFAFSFADPESCCLSDTSVPGRHALLYGADQALYTWCCKQLTKPIFRHYLSSVLTLWQKQNQAASTAALYVLFHDGWIDVAAFRFGRLLFCNSFALRASENAVYYILYVWQQLGLQVEKDDLWIGGKDVPEIISFLSAYVRHVRELAVPSEAYLISSQWNEVPLEIISLFLCES